jgi:hypothetical protein
LQHQISEGAKTFNRKGPRRRGCRMAWLRVLRRRKVSASDDQRNLDGDSLQSGLLIFSLFGTFRDTPRKFG